MMRAPVAHVVLLTLVMGCGPSVVLDDGGSGGTMDDAGADGPGDPPAPAPAPDGGGDGTPGEGDGAPTTITAGDDDDGSTGDVPDVPGFTVQLASGEHFIDAFFIDAGLVLVHAAGAQLVARDGEVLASYESPRTITAAALAGDLLVLADQARLTTLDPTFDGTHASADLVESCASGVLLSGARFVCGPENDWDRIFYTYDALSGALLASSEPYTYNGIPMRAVPGFDELVTVDHASSPSDVHLYAIDPQTGAAVYVNESPYHGDFAVGTSYAFVGSPATHVVTEGGVMLRIHGEGCVAGSRFDSECFVQDGELGTLPPDVLLYSALRESADGTLYGIFAEEWFGFEPCADAPCTLQRIDPQAHLVIAETTFYTDRQWALVRPDPTAAATAVITADEVPFAVGFDEDAAFEVFYAPL